MPRCCSQKQVAQPQASSRQPRHHGTYGTSQHLCNVFIRELFIFAQQNELAKFQGKLLDGVPDRPSIEHYVKIVRDKAILRGLIHVANNAIAKASEQADPADEILNEAEAAVFQLSEKRIGKGFQGITEIVRNSFGSVDALLQRGQRITGLRKTKGEA